MLAGVTPFGLHRLPVFFRPFGTYVDGGQSLKGFHRLPVFFRPFGTYDDRDNHCRGLHRLPVIYRAFGTACANNYIFTICLPLIDSCTTCVLIRYG